MVIEDYFDFVSADEIRIRGTRIGIEAVLREYLDGTLPEEVAINYPPLTLEQVHATITYYLANRLALNQYLERWTRHGLDALQRQEQDGAELLQRLIQPRRSVRTA